MTNLRRQALLRARLAWRLLRGKPVCYRMKIRNGSPSLDPGEPAWAISHTTMVWTGSVTLSEPLLVPYGVNVVGGGA